MQNLFCFRNLKWHSGALFILLIASIAHGQPEVSLQSGGSGQINAIWPVTTGIYNLETTKTPEVPASWLVALGTLDGNGNYNRTADLSTGREFFRLSLQELAPNTDFLISGYLHGEGFGVFGLDNGNLIPLSFNPSGTVPNVGEEFVGPAYMEHGGQLAFFTMQTAEDEVRLWKYDGHTVSLVEGLQGGHPMSLTPLGDKLFFTADTPMTNGDIRREVWWTNGVFSGQVARPSGEFGYYWEPEIMFVMNGELYAYGEDESRFLRMEGDAFVKAGGTTYYDGDEDKGIVVNGIYYYEGYSSSFEYELYSYDGINTTQLTNLDFNGYSDIEEMIPFGTGLLFSEYESGDLYFMDLSGFSPQVNLVGDLDYVQFLTEFAGTAYFEANDTLYESDGTTVSPVANVPTASINGLGINGSELLICGKLSGNPDFWSYDGSTFTSVSADTNVESASRYENFQASNGQLLFTGNYGFSGGWGNKRKHLLFDGSSVRQLESPVVATADAEPFLLGEINGVAYFMADDGSGTKPYKYDPASGISEAPALGNIYTGLSDFEVKVADDKIFYFSFDTANAGAQKGIWAFDGNQSQFVLPGTSFNDIRSLYPVSGEWVLATSRYDATTGTGFRLEIGGQSSSTSIDFAPFNTSNNPPTVLGAGNGNLYVAADDDANYRNLWAYNLVDGHRRIANINPNGSSSPTTGKTLQSNISQNELFFFAAKPDGTNWQMFYTDGSSVSFGPQLVDSPSYLWVSDGDAVYYPDVSADNGTMEIYRFNFFNTTLSTSYPNDSVYPILNLYKNASNESVLYFTQKNNTELVSLTGTTLETVFSGPLPAPGSNVFHFVTKIGDDIILQDESMNFWINQGEIPPVLLANFLDDGSPYRDDPAIMMLDDSILFAGAGINPQGEYVGSELWVWDQIDGFNLADDINSNPVTLDLGGAPAGIEVQD